MAAPLHVAAGIILNAEGEVLLALRPLHKHQGGLWEFPGGKVEPGESAERALRRELEEELNLQAGACAPFLVIDHDYGDKCVRLDVWLVTSHQGTVHGREGQQIAWVALTDLHNHQFPAANQGIVTALQQWAAGREGPP